MDCLEKVFLKTIRKRMLIPTIKRKSDPDQITAKVKTAQWQKSTRNSNVQFVFVRNFIFYLKINHLFIF